MKRHQLDLFSLIAGLAFVAVAVLYLLDSTGQLKVNGRLVIPLLLIALGFAGLAGALLRMARGSSSTSEQEPADGTGPRPAPQSGPPQSGPPPTRDPAGGSYRYDDLSPDLEALGLLDDPAEPPKPSSER